MKQKTVLMTTPIFIVLVTLSAFAMPAAAPSPTSTEKLFLLGVPAGADARYMDYRMLPPKSAYGLILVYAQTNPDIAQAWIFLYLPELRETIFIKLVKIDYLTISDRSIMIIGFWDVYINGRLAYDNKYLTLSTPMNPDWTYIGIPIGASFNGRVIYHSYQAS